jgi:hypothetical protein
MRSYEDDGWLLASDAQLTKTAGFVRESPDNWQWTWILPYDEIDKAGDCEWKRLHEEGRIDIVEFPWPSNVLQARYDFRMDEMRYVLSGTKKHDVILCEVPEHVVPLRVAMAAENMDIPIISMYEHVDVYDETDRGLPARMLLRQLEGYIGSDICAFPLEGLKEEWFSGVSRLVSNGVYNQITGLGKDAYDKSTIWPCIFSEDEILGLAPEQQEKLDNIVPTIFFISRLSDNQRTHYEEFFKATKILQSEGIDFMTLVANPNNALTEGEIKMQCANAVTVSTDRQSYIDHLWTSDIVPILYPMRYIYSVGFCEAATARNHIITAENEPRNVFGDPYIPGTIEVNPRDPESIAAGIKHSMGMTSEIRRGYAKKTADWVSEALGVRSNMNRIIHDVESLVNTPERAA